jgi:hypothetical protein
LSVLAPDRTYADDVSTPDVDAFLAGLSHAHLDGIRLLRSAILGADDRIVEHIKWNAPSFGVGGDDLVTMRLAPDDAFQVVFHRGVVKQPGAVTVSDPDELLQWRSRDRAVVDVGPREAELEPAIIQLVRDWIAAVD